MKLTSYILLYALFWLAPNISFSQVEEKVDTLSETIKNLQQKIDSLNEQLKVKESPIKLSIGASFDFLSGRSETDLYYDINFFMPKIWENDSTKFWKNVGFDFSFYQTRLFGDSMLINIDQEPKSFGMLNSDTLLAEKYTLSRERKTTLENIGVFFNPTYRLRQNLYGLFYFEGIIQKEKVSFNDKYINVDSMLIIPKVDYVEPTSKLREIQPGEKLSTRQNDYRLFLGLGVMLDVTIFDVNFRFKPVVGYMKIKPWLGDSANDNEEGFFYNFNVQIVAKNTGIKLGGQVRYQFNKFPYYSIFLSKQFLLSKLGEFITSK